MGEIDDLPSIDQANIENEHNHEAHVDLSKTSPTFFIEEISSEPIKIEVKTEELGEDEKYRKMRLQNNESSRKCRLKKKKKKKSGAKKCLKWEKKKKKKKKKS